jgi:molecular chaperone DnaK (HSP70)
MLAVGIDIGTSNSCVVSGESAAELEVLGSAVGGSVTPSYVTVGPSEVQCGDVSKQRQATNVDCTFYEFKRIIGRVWREKHLWNTVMHVPFKLTSPRDPEKPPKYTAALNGELVQLTAYDLYVHLMRHLLAELPKDKPMSVVVTVPAHFNDNQRGATVAAARKVLPAGSVVNVLNEPTAAAVAYLSKASEPPDGTLLVVDVGGGTTDITLLRAGAKGIHVLASNYPTPQVGGAKMTDAVHSAIESHCRRNKIKVTKDGKVLLHDRAEQAKRVLSSVTSTDVALTGLGGGEEPGKPYELTREALESFVNNDIMGICEVAVATCEGRAPRHVVLVGGATRIPLLRKRLQDMFPDAKVCTDINPETAVARGAALQAITSKEQRKTAMRVVSETLNATIGVRVQDDDMFPLQRKGLRIPCTKTQRFKPVSSGQRSMGIVVAQGEDPRVSRNTVLGEFSIEGAREIELELRISVGGEVKLTACDSKTRQPLINNRLSLVC